MADFGLIRQVLVAQADPGADMESPQITDSLWSVLVLVRIASLLRCALGTKLPNAGSPAKKRGFWLA